MQPAIEWGICVFKKDAMHWSLIKKSDGLTGFFFCTIDQSIISRRSELHDRSTSNCNQIEKWSFTKDDGLTHWFNMIQRLR